MTTNTNLITLNYFNFTSVLSDVANPFVNPETIIVMGITAHNAFTVLNELSPKFTTLSVTSTGTTVVDTEGVRFAFYSTLDNTLTITPSYKDRFFTNLEGKVNLVALGGGETPALNVTPTASTSVVNNPAFQQQQEDAQVEQFNEDGLDEHYYANYGDYNTHITPIDMDAEREKSPNSFAIPPQEFATPNFAASQTTQQEAQAKRVLAVDGACSGNPGTFEFQMVWADNGEQLNHKHYGELIGTNNIAEVLGLCTAAHYVVSNNLQDSVAIKYDSITAKAWLDKGAHKITSKKVSPQAIQNVENALSFINSNRELINKIEFVKHDTKANGEIEADFNRKK